MKKTERTLQELVRDWLDPSSIEYSDSFSFNAMVQRYGYEAVKKEIKIQSEKSERR